MKIFAARDGESHEPSPAGRFHAKAMAPPCDGDAISIAMRDAVKAGGVAEPPY